MYKVGTQTDNDFATITIHNYIQKSNVEDSVFQTAETENYFPEGSASESNNNRTGHAERDGNDGRWIAVRDSIVADVNSRT